MKLPNGNNAKYYQSLSSDQHVITLTPAWTNPNGAVRQTTAHPLQKRAQAPKKKIALITLAVIVALFAARTLDKAHFIKSYILADRGGYQAAAELYDNIQLTSLGLK